MGTFYWLESFIECLRGLTTKTAFLQYEPFLGGMALCVLPTACVTFVSGKNWRYSRVLAGVLAALSSGMLFYYWLPIPWYEPTLWAYFWPAFFIVSLFGIALFEPRLRRLGLPGRIFTLSLGAFLLFFALAVVLCGSTGVPSHLG